MGVGEGVGWQRAVVGDWRRVDDFGIRSGRPDQRVGGTGPPGSDESHDNQAKNRVFPGGSIPCVHLRHPRLGRRHSYEPRHLGVVYQQLQVRQDTAT